MHPRSLSYLRGKKAGIARREKRYVVRVFHPRVRYPRGCLSLPEALYFADDEIAFCVTHTKRWVPGRRGRLQAALRTARNRHSPQTLYAMTKHRTEIETAAGKLISAIRKEWGKELGEPMAPESEGMINKAHDL